MVLWYLIVGDTFTPQALEKHVILVGYRNDAQQKVYFFSNNYAFYDIIYYRCIKNNNKIFIYDFCRRYSLTLV